MKIKMRCPSRGTIRILGIIMMMAVVVICITSTSFISNSNSTEPFIIHIDPDVNIEANNAEDIVETSVYLGEFKITAYCKENYPHICNNGDATNTATMTTPTPGRTIAVDPSKIPYGSKVIIDGHTYIAEDCGSGIKGKRIDILFETHKEALELGIKYKDVSIIKQ